MSATADAMMEAGELGMVLIDIEVYDRLVAATGWPVTLGSAEVWARAAQMYIACPAIDCEAARAWAADARVSEQDRKSLRWLLEVSGIDDPPDEETAGPLETAQQCCECGKWGQPHWLVRDLGTGWRVCVDCG